LTEASQATMEQHQTSAQTRFDTLESQQSGLGTRFDSLEDQQSEFGANIAEVTTTVSGIRNEQANLRQINEDLLHRIHKLEESSNTSITLRSPVRKCRPKTDDSSQNSTTEDSPQSMVTDDLPSNTGWDNQDEILEFSDEETMDEIKTPPRTSASAGSNPGRRS
jgi:peptidoglycan hydrolase CwlO-like protein